MSMVRFLSSVVQLVGDIRPSSFPLSLAKIWFQSSAETKYRSLNQRANTPMCVHDFLKYAWAFLT